VALDLVAGPSEILVIADASADPRFVAADLLSQAEHGSGRELALLVTTAPELIPRVMAELERQSAQLSRREAIGRVLAAGVHLILVESLARAAAVASAFAPEHLEILTARPRTVARRITAAGAIFLGPWTPEPVGDFVAGPSHVLPTGGAARFFSGLTLEQFYRRMSVVEYDRRALAREQDAIARIARLEGLDAHGRSAAIRGEAP
jgi:histidinol dehydrogenase